MALPTNQEIDNAIRTSNTGTDADRPIRLSTNELLKAFRQEIANTQQDLANKVNNSTFNALADVASSGKYNDLSERPQQYGGTGQNTDGYMTQKAVTDELKKKADLVAGKIPIEQLPSSLASGVVFKGTWSAATNQDNSGNPLPATPTNDSEYYIVNTAGTQFGLTFAAGDWIIAVDGQWYKLEPDSTVSSVNGKTGAVVIDVGVTSVGVTVPTGLVVTNTPVTGTGTIDITLDEGYKIPTEEELEDKGIEPPAGWLEAGNETKYLAGDGTLKDIPSDTQSDYAQTNPNAPDYIKNKPALFSGSYDDLEDKPTIPTKTSELTNDSEFITDASLADLNEKVDAALTKTFAPWQPEVIGGTGIDLPNVIDMFGSSDPITLTGSTVRMERTGFPSAEDARLMNGLKSDSINFGDTASLYYKVKSSLDVDEVASPIFIGFSNSAFDSLASVSASISGGALSLNDIGELIGSDDNTKFNPPIEVPITDDSEYCVSYDKALNKITFFVDGVEIASHTFATDFGFDVVTGSVYVDASNYQGDPSTLTLWGETEFLSDPAYPISGLEPLIIGAGGYVIDETKYPQSPEGKGYEIVGLDQPAQWDALGKEVKNGDFIVFDNDGMPVLMNEEPTVAQETGNSETAVMSQKAVTDELDNKVDKIQAKEILTANKTLTAADSGKLLLINADGITITLPANSNFSIDIAKMDEGFTTVVQCAGSDKFREGTSTISVIRDVSITNSGIAGKEWLAIGAYEV